MFSNLSTKSLELRVRNTLLQKFLQTDMIFFDQFIASTVKFGKCFGGVYDTDSLNMFYCNLLYYMQCGWATSSSNISYAPP